MKSNYNRDRVATAEGKALIHPRPFDKHEAYRISCRVAEAFGCRLHRSVCVALILSVLTMSTPAAPQTIVALILNPQSAITAPSGPQIELPADLLALNNSVELPDSLGAKHARPREDSSTPLFALSARTANYNTPLMPQGGGSVTYSSAGTFTWTAPAGVTSATVETWGGGGGGGGGLQGGASGGGGGGAYSNSTLSVTGGTGYTVVVGAGGAGGNGNDNSSAGGNGGDSTFNSTSVVAKGGTGGERGATGGGGAGGAASGGTGTTKYSGGNGAAHVEQYYDSGGGGSSAGTGANGNNASGHTGGSAPAGGGAGGKGGAYTGSGTNGAIPGSAPGGGGGGDIVFSAGGISGAAGATGKVVITFSGGVVGGSTTGWTNCKQSYGATGDGTTDDTAAANACFTAAGNGVAYFPKGTYILNVAGSPSADAVVKGDGPGITILKRKSNSASGSVFGLSAPRITVKDLTIDGNCASPGGGPGSYTCSNQANGSYADLQIDAADIAIDDVEFKNSQAVTIFVVAARTKVMNSKFTGAGLSNGGPAFGIQTHGTYSSEMLVEHSVFSDYKLNGIITDGPNHAIKFNRFYGNHRQNTVVGGGQIDISGSTPGSTFASIIGNEFFVGGGTAANLTSCIEVTSGGIISGNKCEGGGVHLYGIGIQGGQHYTISSNIVKGYTQGLHVDEAVSATDYIIARNNDFSDNALPLSITTTGTHNAINALVTEIGKGADVASAGTITPSGSTFAITGTTTISTISTTNVTVGTIINMITTSGVTFDETGNIDITGATSLTTSPGYLVHGVWDGTKWRLR